jgi:DNA-binding PadR family transcriptional regulator
MVPHRAHSVAFLRAGCGSRPQDIEKRYRKPILATILIVREFLRGAVRLHILHHAAQHAVHGAWLAAELAGHGYTISPGSLYPTLHKMEAEGLIRSRSALVDGRVLRSYAVTAQGRRELRAARQQLRELANEVLGDPAP